MRCTVLLMLLFVLQPDCAVAVEPNDVFANATTVGAARVVVDRIDFSTRGPDLTLGVVDDQGELVRVDDDGSFFGNGLASALLGEPVPTDGVIRLSISGAGDFDFDGLDDATGIAHVETGDFGAYLSVYDEAGRLIASQDFQGQHVPGVAVDFMTSAHPEWIGGTYDIELNNFFGPPSDVDFWRFTDAEPGAVFIAEVTAGGFDSLLGWYDELGALVRVDDEGGGGGLSRLEGVVPASGEVLVAVTAYPDFGFQGVHSATGEYTLQITVVPEPTSVALLTLALGSRRSRTMRSSRPLGAPR